MGFNPKSLYLLTHCIVNEVHGISNILEHASVGHEQVAVLVTLQEAGRDEEHGEREEPFEGQLHSF